MPRNGTVSVHEGPETRAFFFYILLSFHCSLFQFVKTDKPLILFAHPSFPSVSTFGKWPEHASECRLREGAQLLQKITISGKHRHSTITISRYVEWNLSKLASWTSYAQYSLIPWNIPSALGKLKLHQLSKRWWAPFQFGAVSLTAKTVLLHLYSIVGFLKCFTFLHTSCFFKFSKKAKFIFTSM